MHFLLIAMCWSLRFFRILFVLLVMFFGEYRSLAVDSVAVVTHGSVSHLLKVSEHNGTLDSAH